MAPSVKLAIVSKTGEEASLLRKSACLSSSLHSSRKQPYLVSITSYKLSVKVFYFLRAFDFNGFYKNHVRQNGG